MIEKRNSEMQVKYCPNCGESLFKPYSLFNEYWVANDTVYFCWCSECSWRGEILEMKRVTAPELASS